MISSTVSRLYSGRGGLKAIEDVTSSYAVQHISRHGIVPLNVAEVWKEGTILNFFTGIGSKGSSYFKSRMCAALTSCVKRTDPDILTIPEEG